MKQYLDKGQTTKLIELGFPRPKPSFYENGATWIQCDGNYSIGELIEFLESNTDINIWYDGKSHYWYVDYGLRRIGLDNNLVDALYFACKTLKEEEMV